MKRSLHFGINQYAPLLYGNVNPLQQCVHDAERLAALATEYHFDETSLITDAQATTTEFKSRMRDLAERSAPGDVVWFTQSSHGTYFDKTGKRLTGLCMHDYILWDYEARKVLKLFAKGVIVIWMTDACFSQDNWRALLPKTDSKPAARFLETTPVKNVIKPASGSKRDLKCSLLIYSSSNIFQPSYEDRNGGAYTTAIVQAAKGQYGKQSYYQIAKRAAQAVAQKYPQTPIFETSKAEAFTGYGFLNNY